MPLSAHRGGGFGRLESHLKALITLKRKVCKYELVVKGQWQDMGAVAKGHKSGKIAALSNIVRTQALLIVKHSRCPSNHRPLDLFALVDCHCYHTSNQPSLQD